MLDCAFVDVLGVCSEGCPEPNQEIYLPDADSTVKIWIESGQILAEAFLIIAKSSENTTCRIIAQMDIDGKTIEVAGSQLLPDGAL